MSACAPEPWSEIFLAVCEPRCKKKALFAAMGACCSRRRQLEEDNQGPSLPQRALAQQPAQLRRATANHSVPPQIDTRLNKGSAGHCGIDMAHRLLE